MCTNLAIPATSAQRVSARTLDLDQTFTTEVVLVPRHETFPRASHLHRPLEWTTEYGFIGMLVANLDPVCTYFTDGLNERGLSAAALWLAGSEYPPPGHASPEKRAVYNTDFPGWILGTCATVDDVKKAVRRVTVIDIRNAVPGLRIPLHFIFSDATGAHVVVEFMGGEMQVYDNADGVLTNQPPYDWQLTNLATHVNLGLANRAAERWGQPMNGSGLLGMPGDATPQSRFVRASMLVQSMYAPVDARQAVGLAMQLISTCIVPYNTIVPSSSPAGSPKALGDRTQWVVARDHMNGAYYFATPFNTTLHRIDLTAINFATAQSGTMKVVQPAWYRDVTDAFGPS